MDRRTRAYRSKLRRQRDFLFKLAWFLIGSIAILATMLWVSLNSRIAQANSAEVITPVVDVDGSAETIPVKNPHCIGEYNKLFCNEKYDWEPMTMIAIATCESRLNPQAIALEPNNTYSAGLLQVNSVHGYSPSELFDPVRNVELGYKVYQSQGYYAWSVFGGSCFYNEYAKLAAL